MTMSTVVNNPLHNIKPNDTVFQPTTTTIESNNESKQNHMSLSTNDIFHMDKKKTKSTTNGMAYSSLVLMSSYDSCRGLFNDELHQYGSQSLPSTSTRSYAKQLIDLFPVFGGKRKTISYFQKTSSSITLTEASRKHYNDLWVGSLK
ncbi:unnamed protein product [Schistosoma turkestanicum]|nr:unnamed protein product [Schistosoma turkestanicum]